MEPNTYLELGEKQKYIHIAKVKGIGDFPFDMLRYDACFPAESEDAGAMYHYANREMRTVYVKAFSESKAHWPFTPKRWESFGWSCSKHGMYSPRDRTV
jgi:hypothetical protein